MVNWLGIHQLVRNDCSILNRTKVCTNTMQCFDMAWYPVVFQTKMGVLRYKEALLLLAKE